jgi:hypothetical protein
MATGGGRDADGTTPVTPGAVINLLTHRPESGIWINRTRVVVK